MTIAKFIWEKVRLFNRLPGAYLLYECLINIAIRDGKTVCLKRGPAKGYLWRNYKCYQAWMAMGLYEPHVANLIYDILNSGDTFYDVGANAGYFTLVGAKAVRPNGKVVAFDPVPVNVSTIKKQIEINNLNDCCVVEPVAISNSNGNFSFVVSKKNANSHLSDFQPSHLVGKEQETINVKAITLDDYIKQHPKPHLIKIDIEGAEVAALEGAKKLLSSQDAPVFLISVHSLNLEKQVKMILQDNHYELVNLQGFEQMVFARPSR